MPNCTWRQPGVVPIRPGVDGTPDLPCGRKALYEFVQWAGDPVTGGFTVVGFRCSRHRERAGRWQGCYRLGVPHCDQPIGRGRRACTHRAWWVVTRTFSGLRSLACAQHAPEQGSGEYAADRGFKVERYA